jgi:hypothetical protein
MKILEHLLTNKKTNGDYRRPDLPAYDKGFGIVHGIKKILLCREPIRLPATIVFVHNMTAFVKYLKYCPY